MYELLFPVACVSFPDSYTCDINQGVVIPQTTNNITRERTLGITRLILRCDVVNTVVPSPLYTWIKDDLTVVRDLSKTSMAMIDDEFMTAGNNSLLFLITPLPIMVTFNRIVIDFTASNSSFTGGVVIEDLQRFVLDAVQGRWSCSVANVFGNISGSSIVSSKS